MKTITTPYLGAMLIAILGICSSCELQSDEELREDIVGSWKREACEFPYNTEDNDVTEASPLRSYIIFYADGRIDEDGYYAYCCVDDCDSLPERTCTWAIENGNLIILPDVGYSLPWLNRQFPLCKLDDDELVFDNVEINGITQKKACYSRQ
jgi:hypothetical protein